MSYPTLLALDFDGVICDGLIEYFQTAWQAYCQMWQPLNETPPAGLAEQFYRLRPVVETGWEMPVLLRSLLLEIPESELFANWSAIANEQAQAVGLTPAQISTQVDHIRDEWIARDLDDWLEQHRFYPGIIERLQQWLSSSLAVVIITTKEQRFVLQLLQRQGLQMSATQIFGKELRQPKAETLRMLIAKLNDEQGEIWFVEDRLKTLQTIQRQPDLQNVQLFLADWGYNTEADRQIAQQDPLLHLLSLAQFSADFSAWRSAACL
jgi:phosphoglycolate phosphatase-like HAD superfamily hydrolase